MVDRSPWVERALRRELAAVERTATHVAVSVERSEAHYLADITEPVAYAHGIDRSWRTIGDLQQRLAAEDRWS